MKNLQKIRVTLTRTLAVIAMAFFSSMAWAQDKGVDIDVDLNKHDAVWYQNPIVWVIGVAVFILLLVALMRSGKSNP